MTADPRLMEFRRRHAGQIAYLLCNGPSLNDVDFEELKGEVVFGTNKIYLKPEALDVLTYYVAVNPLVIEQAYTQIIEMNVPRFLPQGVWHHDLRGEYFHLDTSHREPSFRDPLVEPVWEGHTVSYVAMQLAAAMGISHLFILGMDHEYKAEGAPNAEARAYDKDANHFDPGYFTNGDKWNLPDLANSELAYAIAQDRAANYWGGLENMAITNISSRTKCKIFPLVPPARHRARIKTTPGAVLPKVTAIVSAYNGADKYLAGCMDDLKAQTERPEIIVVCREGSPEHKMLVKDVSIRLFTTAHVPTIYEAWNLAARHASGEYLTNANVDDRHHPRAFEIAVAVLDARPDKDLAYYDQYITWTPNQTFAEFEADLSSGKVKALQPGRFEDQPGYFAWPEYSREALTEGCFMGPQPMWRASLHQLHGFFDGEMKSAGDYEFWLRIAGPDNMVHIPQFLGLYLARLDGAELRDPALSDAETQEALRRAQAGGASFTPLGDLVRVAVGGEFVWVYKKDVLKQVSG